MEHEPLRALAYETPGERLKVTTRQVFLMWEKLRLVYNAVLLSVVLAVAFVHKGTEARWAAFVVICLLGCVGANLCFFAGASIDAYLNWLGYRHSAITAVIFGLGLVLSMILAAGFAMTAINPR